MARRSTHAMPPRSRGCATARQAISIGAGACSKRSAIPAPGRTCTSRVAPQIYGDAFGEGPEAPKDALTLLAVTPTQYAHLQRWLAGNVIDDWPGAPPVPPAFATLTPAEQVAHLERAPLTDCLGGPFHPGIELTWMMRLARVWKRAYRLNVLVDRSAGAAEFWQHAHARGLYRSQRPIRRRRGRCADALHGRAVADRRGVLQFGGRLQPVDLPVDADLLGRARARSGLRRGQLRSRRGARSASARWCRRTSTSCCGSTGCATCATPATTSRIAKMVEKWWELGMVLPVPDPPAHLPPDTRVEQGRVGRTAARRQARPGPGGGGASRCRLRWR